MFKNFGCITFFAVVIMLTGCAGLGNMKEVAFEDRVEPSVAMVNFVRRSVFQGDGAKVEVWDGDNFIGTLAAGRLLQYTAQPGDHTFMVYVQGSWGVAAGDLRAGKSYYLKFNMPGFGIGLGVAKADDPRIEEWNTMTTVTLDEAAPKEIPEKYILGAQKTLERVRAGNAVVTPIADINAL
jgi:hypothetical protein